MTTHTTQSLGLKDHKGTAPIHGLAREGGLAEVLPLLTPELLNQKDGENLTPLDYAVREGHIDQILPILTPEFLAKPSVTDQSTIVHTAVRLGFVDQLLSIPTAELLSLKDSNGYTPVHFAAIHGQLAKILPWLAPNLLRLTNQHGWTPVHYAARRGHLNQLLSLLTTEILCLKTEQEVTPVHLAASFGHLDQILPWLTPELLSLVDKGGFTPVHCAANHGCLDQILPLLSVERLTRKDGRGYTPLHYAALKPANFMFQPSGTASQLELLKPFLTRELCALEADCLTVAAFAVGSNQYGAISHLFPIEQLTCTDFRRWQPPVAAEGDFVINRAMAGPCKELGLPEPKTQRIASFAPNESSPIIELPFAVGTTARISQGYDGLLSHGGETSIDFDLPIGTPICAAFDGQVTLIKVDGSPITNVTCRKVTFMDSNRIYVRSEDGLFASYAHLDVGGVLVKPGEQVKAGQVIGYGGNTGVVKPHLHFSTFRIHEINPDVRVPVPTWFRTTEGKAALQNGHSYTRPELGPQKPAPPSARDRFLPTKREPATRLHNILFRLPLFGQALLSKWLSAEVNPGGITRLHTMAEAGLLEPWLVNLIPDRLLGTPEPLKGTTPVQVAAGAGHLDQLWTRLTLQLLRQQNQEGNTAIHFSAARGHLDQILPLLTPKLLAETSNKGNTPVHAAAVYGHLDQILSLLTPELLSQADHYGFTAVHFAAEYCFIHQIADLLTLELLSTTNKYGDTPVAIARRTGQLAAIKHLLPREKEKRGPVFSSKLLARYSS